MPENTNSSPFKFLSPYDKSDKDIYFGREEEGLALYDMVRQSNLILLYGPSGTGKTSLIMCDLANRFQPMDWLEVRIRRRRNIQEAFSYALRDMLRKPEDAPEDASFVQLLKVLFRTYYRPIYLIFDQFEELFIINPDKQEQNAFFQELAEIVDNEGIPVHVLLVMRDEYISRLYSFEKEIPRLFDYKIRVEPMNYQNVAKVIEGTCASFGIELRDADNTISAIVNNINPKQTGIQLAYLQIYLDKLYHNAIQAGTPNVFTPGLVLSTGDIGLVLKNFLIAQKQEITKRLQEKWSQVQESQVNKILWKFATLQGTKVPLTKEAIVIPNLPMGAVVSVLEQLEQARLLRLDADGVTYELAHDTLARHIADDRATDPQALLLAEITKIIRDRFGAYPTTKVLLSEQEMLLINANESKLREEGEEITRAHWNYISDSNIELARLRKKKDAEIRRLRIIIIAAILGLIIAVIGAFVAIKATSEAEREKMKLKNEKEKTEAVFKKYRDEQESKARLEFASLLIRTKDIIDAHGCPSELFRDMRNIANNHSDSISLRQQIEQMQERVPNCR